MSFRLTLLLGLFAAILLPSTLQADWRVQVYLEEDWVLKGEFTPQEIAIKSESLNSGPVQLGKTLSEIKRIRLDSYQCYFKSGDKVTGVFAKEKVHLHTEYGALEIPTVRILRIVVISHKEPRAPAHDRHGAPVRDDFRGRPGSMGGGPGGHPPVGPTPRGVNPRSGHGERRGTAPPLEWGNKRPPNQKMDRPEGNVPDARGPRPNRQEQDQRLRSEIPSDNLSDVAWIPIVDFPNQSWQALSFLDLPLVDR